MKNSSSTSFNHGWTYDVFVSFYGDDTLYGFTGNLYNTLGRKGINTFKDDIKLKKGEEISTDLLQTIDESRIAIIGANWCSSTASSVHFFLILLEMTMDLSCHVDCFAGWFEGCTLHLDCIGMGHGKIWIGRNGTALVWKRS
ncbi:hypothetical protein KIW84_076209 [Lathyrus oleraceus]|uniref:ADP-ribosyl cyclase/cyclic ADP-ribose hydrolase n=1 Tax=Pisum sativum TaxID=3888 RepID=A0A9D4VVS2_PEA|nr:hypothetical protein KIW84_076209 [Pisum sativum]